VNYQRSEIRTQQRIVSNELEVIANAVASEAMHHVATKSFDAAVASGAVTRDNPNAKLLTPASSFGNKAYADAVDIDDFNGVKGHRVFYEVEDSLGFDLDVEFVVTYVDDGGAKSLTPTLTKQVAVRVSSADNLFNPIEMTRQFSPRWY
jgi:hypothetical protein